MVMRSSTGSWLTLVLCLCRSCKNNRWSKSIQTLKTLKNCKKLQTRHWAILCGREFLKLPIWLKSPHLPTLTCVNEADKYQVPSGGTPQYNCNYAIWGKTKHFFSNTWKGCRTCSQISLNAGFSKLRILLILPWLAIYSPDWVMKHFIRRWL